MKNHRENERSSIQREPFSKQCKSLEELKSALAASFKQTHESYTHTDDTHLKKKGSHISAHLVIVNFWPPTVGSTELRDTTFLTEIYQVTA